jgi:NAD(P)H-dependent FMN reductase
MNVIAISGSLRTRSSNTALLRAMARIAAPAVSIDLYEGIDALPHFNPDVEEVAPPEVVIDLRSRLNRACGVLISSPEYAHGVPGVLKNALDWLVGAGELVGKPVAVINASPYATHANASLLETLRVMSWGVVADACVSVPLAGRRLDEAGIASDPEISATLKRAIEAFVTTIRQ